MKKVEFTPTEEKVIKMICKQMTSQEIAEKLGFSKRTIEGYRETILRKTKSRSLVGIVLYAIKNDLHTVK
jgi:DNA-binding CsgD family transcriptional regulator